jgi:site-specific DNA-cytosine methylase
VVSHVEIVPLIGGSALAAAEAFGSRPDYILSYSPFETNESHLREYWGHGVPYVVLDKSGKAPINSRPDVVGTTCPCAGLSMFGLQFGEGNPNNQWMIKSARYVLSELKPRVMWGENSGNLVGSIGEPIRKQLVQIGKENGYTASFYRTRSLLHGVPQVRERTFYFFWQGAKTPLLEYYKRDYTPIEEVILGARGNSMQEPINKNVPTSDPYYRYLLEVVMSGMTHHQLFDSIDTKAIPKHYYDAKSLIEWHGHDYRRVGAWMGKNGYENEVAKCERMFLKLDDGKNIMRRGTVIPKDYIGAFVGHYPKSLTHPYEDRYITYREALTIMGMPQDFQLLNPTRSYNHICQNVPVQTARDMANEVKAVLEGHRNWVDTDMIVQHNHTGTHEINSTKTNDIMEFFQ